MSPQGRDDRRIRSRARSVPASGLPSSRASDEVAVLVLWAVAPICMAISRQAFGNRLLRCLLPVWAEEYGEPGDGDHRACECCLVGVREGPAGAERVLQA